MANTTDIMITTFFDNDAIKHINKEINLDLKQFSDGSKAGGSKVLSFKIYGTCLISIGINKINSLIKVFKNTEFTFPEYAILFIDDDNNDFSKTIHR